MNSSQHNPLVLCVPVTALLGHLAQEGDDRLSAVEVVSGEIALVAEDNEPLALLVGAALGLKDLSSGVLWSFYLLAKLHEGGENQFRSCSSREVQGRQDVLGGGVQDGG